MPAAAKISAFLFLFSDYFRQIILYPKCYLRIIHSVYMHIFNTVCKQIDNLFRSISNSCLLHLLRFITKPVCTDNYKKSNYQKTSELSKTRIPHQLFSLYWLYPQSCHLPPGVPPDNMRLLCRYQVLCF